MRYLERPSGLGDVAQAAEDLRTLSARVAVACIDDMGDAMALLLS